MGMILQYVCQVPLAVMDPAQSRLSYIDLYTPNKGEKRANLQLFSSKSAHSKKKKTKTHLTGKRRLLHFLLCQEMRRSEQPLQTLCGFAQKLHSLPQKHGCSLRES